MGDISPIVLSWIVRDQKRARIKALKDAADAADCDACQAEDKRVRARLLEAEEHQERAELERVCAQIKVDGVNS